MHVPNAVANLLPTELMSDAECTTSFGKLEDVYYCNIECHQGITCKADIKYIPTMKIRGVCWIERSNMIDILFRGFHY